MDELIEELVSNSDKIVPVLGDKVFLYSYEEDHSNDVLLQEFIARSFFENNGIQVDDEILRKIASTGYYGMSALEKRFPHKFAYWVERIVRNNMNKISLSPIVSDFLHALRPKMIVTTSPFQILETIFPDYEVKVYVGPDTKENLQMEISDHAKVIYHLFGEARPVRSVWVKTEMDLLNYLHWMHDDKSRPIALSKYLQNKGMLFLGCNFPEWIFRFLWYSVGKEKYDHEHETGYTSGYWMTNKSRPESSFQDFLREINYESSDAVFEILKKVTSALSSSRESTVSPMQKLPLPEGKKHHLFLSFTKEDEDICRKIQAYFEHHGLDVWSSCVNGRRPGGYVEPIRESIESSCYFMPIITNNYLTKWFNKFQNGDCHSFVDTGVDSDLFSETVFAANRGIMYAPVVNTHTEGPFGTIDYSLLRKWVGFGYLPKSFIDRNIYFYSTDNEMIVFSDTVSSVFVK